MTPSERRTFTEIARRAQIVQAAIETIARDGYRAASFARIAAQAGLSSTGLISYHFGTRDELLREVTTEVQSRMGTHMHARLQAAGESAAERLRTYLEASIEFIDAHRGEMRALLEIFFNAGGVYDTEPEQTVRSEIEQILRDGQASGEFREFDVSVMATLVQRAIDTLPFELATQPGLDVSRYSAEVATVFRLATEPRPRAEAPSGPARGRSGS